MDSDISFIGLGQMGYGMATNVRKKLPKNRTMYINDIDQSACERFVKETSSYGPVEIIKTAKETASKTSILISIVPASKHVKQVYLDKENGVIAASQSNDRLLLECSTIDVETTREVGKAIMDVGIGRYIDTPVSGGWRGAAAGTLSFMIGCSESDSKANQVKEITSLMGNPDKIFLCGQLGTGLAAKISNNYLSGTFLVAIAEAMAIGIRSGVDKNKLARVISNSSGMSWMGEHMMPVPDILPDAPSSNGYKPGFRHELMVKDMTLGIEAGKKHGIEPTMASTAVAACKKASEDPRCEGKDASSVYISITDGKDN